MREGVDFCMAYKVSSQFRYILFTIVNFKMIHYLVSVCLVPSRFSGNVNNLKITTLKIMYGFNREIDQQLILRYKLSGFIL